MRIHSNVLTHSDITNSLLNERAAGRIARTVTFDTCSSHGSRTHSNAFEVKLQSYSKETGDGRRWGNTGGYGSTSVTTGEYTATYDEWGFFLSALYRLDPAMVVGSVGSPIYADVSDFNWRTGRWYDLTLAAEIERIGDTMPHVTSRNGKAPRGKAGRIGADRRWSGFDVDQMSRHLLSYIVHAPRTADQVRAFAHLQTVSA